MQSLEISKRVRMRMASRTICLWQPWVDIDVKNFEFSYKIFGMY